MCENTVDLLIGIALILLAMIIVFRTGSDPFK